MTLQHFTIADLQRALHDGELSAREIARQTLLLRCSSAR